MAGTLLPVFGAISVAGELSVTVQQTDARAADAAVVVVVEPAMPAPASHTALKATMNQKELMFSPEILVVRTGTAVEFPNGDSVRHQVYSFSAAKKFQLSLYSGTAHAPVIFDKPGVVTIGCNIHDGMIGYIVVTDSPWFGRTGKDGDISFQNLPAGEYTVRIWHPRITDSAATLTRAVAVAATEPTRLLMTLQKALSPATHNHGTATRWEDY